MKIPKLIQDALDRRSREVPNGPLNLFFLELPIVEGHGYKALPPTEHYAAGDLISVTNSRDTWILIDSEESARMLRKISVVNKNSVIGPNTKVYRKHGA